jgi:LemA protein
MPAASSRPSSRASTRPADVDALLMLVWIAVAILVAVAFGWAISYNRLVAKRQEVADAWATIDVELQRRHALVPRLVESVEAAAAHEQSLLAELARRNVAAAAAPDTPVAASTWEPPLTATVAQVLALRERYPALDSQQDFLALQRELATTEDRIAAARRFYNTRVTRLNTAVDAFPSSVVAHRHGFAHADLFGETGVREVRRRRRRRGAATSAGRSSRRGRA